MAMSGSSVDTRHLEKHGRQYRAKLDVPRKLREVVGKAALKKSLGTDSLAEAQRLRWPALADLRKQLHEITRKAKAAPYDPITAAALEDRTTRGILVDIILREDRPEDVEALALFDRELFDLKAERIQSDHSPAKAREYRGIVRGERTPLVAHVDQWMADVGGLAKRTRKHYRDSVYQLAAFAAEEGLPQTIEAFDRRAAGDFISRRFIDRQGADRTAKKFVSALSAYWRWLDAKGKIARASDNPWRGQVMPTKDTRGTSLRDDSDDGATGGNEPRPFTDDEVSRLLNPGKPDDPVLMEFIRIAALSGMRIDEIGRIRVRDVDLLGLSIHLPRAKTKAGIRHVPIHSDNANIIARRIIGKAPSEWLFPELPEYPPESLSERSMVVTKRFVTYRRSISVDDRAEGQKRSRIDFHSFRRWFVTKAEQAGIAIEIIEAVVGHKRKGMTAGRYSGGPSLEQRRACVEAVKLPQGHRKEV